MLQFKNTIISEDVIKKQFVCDLNKCKGACCVEGESGAPLEEDELAILDEIYPDVEPFLTEDGKEAIKKFGKYMIDVDGDHVTPLVGDELECAYTIFEKGIAKCGIEKAYEQGKVSFRKPISCHLYPIRISKLKSGKEALNYHQWETCSDACVFGKQLQVPVYKFLKDSLIRKYGKQWYRQLEIVLEERES